jgi:RNA polymerase sigma-70 factor (ECF subfamily)
VSKDVKGTGAAMATREIPFRSSEVIVGAAGETGLVERCQKGDPQAFAGLVAVHERMVFSLATRLLGDSEEARDVAQDVFLQVYRTLGRFEGRSSLKTWIYRIVVNHCHNRRRLWSRRARGASRPLDELTANDEAKLSATERGACSPYEQVRLAERAARVQEALLALPFRHRAVVVLRDVEGLSCEEVAEALGLPAGTVKSRLSRARETLRRRLSATISEGETS